MRIRSRGIAPADSSFPITWEGSAVESRPTDSVASALVAAGEYGCRTAGEDDRRGVFCGMGVCGECAIMVEGRGERLACMTPVEPDMRVSRAEARLDLDRPAPDSALPESTLRPDIVVIGAGPAGLAAATTAAEAGLSVVLLDERGKLGGQYYKQPGAAFSLDEDGLDRQFRAGRSSIARARAAGVRTLEGARVWGAASAERLFAASATERWEIFPRRVIIAIGAYERGVPFPGWTLPGVMTTGAGQTLARSYQVSPGSRVLVAGNGPLNMQVAAELTAAGAKVVGLIELGRPVRFSSMLRGPAMLFSAPSLLLDAVRYTAHLVRGRVPFIAGSAVVRAEGDVSGVRSVRVARLDATGTPVAGTTRDFEVDAVCLGYGFLPSNELTRMLGCAHRWDDETQTLAAETDAEGRTSIPEVRVVGDASRVLGAKVARARGTLAGAAVAAELGAKGTASVAPATARARRAVARNLRFQRAVAHAYAAPVLTDQLAEASTIVCRCESVTLETIAENSDDLASTPGAVKRLTRAGMGKCQGRYCGPVLLARSERLRGEATGERSGFAPQPPAKPTPISVIARPD